MRATSLPLAPPVARVTALPVGAAATSATRVAAPPAPLVEMGLFAGLSPEQLNCARGCLGVQAFAFEKDEEVLACQAEHSHYGVLVSGTVFDVRRHAHGEQTLIDVVQPGELFGEGWMSGAWTAHDHPQERAAIAATAGVVLLLDPSRLTDTSVQCGAKPIVQNNLLRAVLGKQERLRTKLEILRHRSLRKRIANYLVVESQRRGAKQFLLPLSRGDLALYLHADRAAVSRELARMRRDGIIDYHRNSFVLADEGALALAAS